MAEKLKISVAKTDMAADIASCKRVSVREKLLRWLFGYKRNVTVLIPGEKIKQLSIEQISLEEIHESL